MKQGIQFHTCPGGDENDDRHLETQRRIADVIVKLIFL